MPGRRVWNGLIEAGLVVLPEEENHRFDDGTEFIFTAYLELTEAGETALRTGKVPDPGPGPIGEAEQDSPSP